MTLGMAYWAVYVTGKNFAKLYPTLHHPTVLPNLGTFMISTQLKNLVHLKWQAIQLSIEYREMVH